MAKVILLHLNRKDKSPRTQNAAAEGNNIHAREAELMGYGIG
jgi:hypothetical protein